MAYDHTDALRSPLLEDAQREHRARMRAAHRMVTIDPEIGFKVDSRLLRPAETLALNPHTRVGY